MLQLTAESSVSVSFTTGNEGSASNEGLMNAEHRTTSSLLNESFLANWVRVYEKLERWSVVWSAVGRNVIKMELELRNIILPNKKHLRNCIVIKSFLKLYKMLMLSKRRVMP
jgi:hypothetical protein